MKILFFFVLITVGCRQAETYDFGETSSLYPMEKELCSLKDIRIDAAEYNYVRSFEEKATNPYLKGLVVSRLLNIWVIKFLPYDKLQELRASSSTEMPVPGVVGFASLVYCRKLGYRSAIYVMDPASYRHKISDAAFSTILFHEIGHAIGLGHASGENSETSSASKTGLMAPVLDGLETYDEAHFELLNQQFFETDYAKSVPRIY